MRIRERQLIYGGLYGGFASVLVWLAALWVTPANLLLNEPRWVVASWLFVNAHGVMIAGTQVGGLGDAFLDYNLIRTAEVGQLLRVFPIIAYTLAAVLLNESMGYTTRLKHLVKNSLAVGIGYLGVALIVFLQSGVQPGFTLFIGILLMVGLAFAVGSFVVDSLSVGVPFIGIPVLGPWS